jgi:hypothetical protein
VAKRSVPPKSRDKNVSVAQSAVTPDDDGGPLPPSRPQWVQWPRSVFGQLLVVAAGIVVGQMFLYGSSLLGQKILLPIDQLSSPGMYTPNPNGTKPCFPHNHMRSDLILVYEPLRHYMAEEMTAGRWPLWTPDQYGGTPMPFGKYSPMWVLRASVRSPVVVAWLQLLVSLSIGFGTYAFCRHALQVSFWPAAVAAWCYPLTGFFIFWEGYSLAWVAGWLPWLLWAIDRTIRRPGGWGGFAIALFTYLIVADRQLDISGQVLMASGIWAVWQLFDEYGWHRFAPRWVASGGGHNSDVFARAIYDVRAILRGWLLGLRSFFASGAVWRRVLALVAGWAFGFLLAAPCLLPTLEYAKTGIRMRQRGSGDEERPPVGLAALPQIVLPDMYGSTQIGYLWMPPVETLPPANLKPGERWEPRLLEGNQLESPSAAYSGLVATLFVAPLAWFSRRHRARNIFLTALGVFGLCWCLDVAWVVALLRLPGLNMMSHNRLVFITSLCVVGMMAIGLEVLRHERPVRAWWIWLPVAVLVILLAFCFYRTIELPEPLGTKLLPFVQSGRTYKWVSSAEDVRLAQATYTGSFALGGALCVIGVAGWFAFWRFRTLPTWFTPALAVVLLGDLLWFANGRSVQCDPAMYYPKIPALEEVKKSTPGRIIGFDCFPPLLNHFSRLGDIRGDDGVEPARMIDLAQYVADPKSITAKYAVTQYMRPKITSSEPFRLTPMADMLNIRYVVFRGEPPARVQPDFVSPDYWVMTNRGALPRAYVPERVEVVKDDKERLAKMGSENFRPRQVAYVEEPVELPEACQGAAEIVEEIPTHLTIALDMKTPGLVVLSDLWDVGWHAYYDGKPVPILRTNHALRGVVAPQGKGTLEFRYDSASMTHGLWLCTAALVVLAGWGLAIVWNSRRRPLPPGERA